MQAPALRALVAVPVLASLAAGCDVQISAHAVVQREEKRFETGATPEVHLTTFDGSVSVRPWDRSEVLVEIEKRGSRKEAVAGIQVLTDKKDNRITLEVKRPATEREFGFGIHRSTSARLVASVPSGARLVIATRDGSINVERIDGRLELRTDDGSVRVSEAAGDMVIVTRDGSITLDRVAGRIDARSGDGSIRLTGAPAAVQLETRDGSVTVRADEGTQMKEDWSVRTGDGSVVVEVPPGFGAELDAETQDGSVRASFDVAGADPASLDRRADRKKLRGKIGSGGKLLKLRTNDGSIRLRSS